MTPTVLVAEDDPLVLEVVTRLVREGGYDTIPARDGREAWGIFQRAKPPIDLVLADVVMPHVSGTELAARVAAMQPELPVILMSACGPEDLLRRALVLTPAFHPTALPGLFATTGKGACRNAPVRLPQYQVRSRADLPSG